VKIRESGLWQEMELYKQPFSQAEFEIFSNDAKRFELTAKKLMT